MNYIVLNPQQTASLTAATAPVEIRGPDGTVLGLMYPKHATSPEPQEDPDFSAADIQEALRRKASNGPRYTTQQVLDHLRSLEGK
jgi:hypothetical protein